MVASSVPNLGPDKVTVVDQNGDLLSQSLGDSGMALTSNQFQFTRKLEERYAQRIEDLLSPVVGQGSVRAQVVADVDFTNTENTTESYDPDARVLRSEQISEETQGTNSDKASGVAGAATNSPAGANAAPVADGQQSTQKENKQSTSKQATRNYEIDKTITHSRNGGSQLKKISVAVVVDDRKTINDNGEVVRTPLTDKELAEMTKLVKDAVGFDAQRGDNVSVINSAFQRPAEPEPLPTPPLWEQPWIQDLIKQALAAVAVLLLVFGVLRPVLRSLAEKGAQVPVAVPNQQGRNVGEDQVTLSGPQQGQLPGPQAGSQYDTQLITAKTMANQDPARVAQVVKSWVAADG
jgi:flagellar M-ring protein FliF